MCVSVNASVYFFMDASANGGKRTILICANMTFLQLIIILFPFIKLFEEKVG